MYNTMAAADILDRATPASPQPTRRSSRRQILAVTILTTLVLFVSTACTAPAGHNGGGNGFVVIVVIALVAAVAMLRAVSRMFGELFHVLTNVAAALAKLGLIAALTTGAVVLAVVVLTQQ